MKLPITILTTVFACSIATAADTGSAPEPVPAPAPAAKPAAQPTASDLSAPRAAIKAQDYKTAITQLDKLAATDGKNADIHNLLGYSHRKSGNLDKAFEHYNTALKLNPKHLGAHEYIGEAYLMAKKPAEAEKHLAELTKLCGKCEEQEDLAKAITDYRAKNKS
jgi:Flp pilus assembly protein TadD